MTTSNKEEIMLDPTTKENIDLWLQGDYDEETKNAILKLLEETPQEAAKAFYTTLSFGTGGLRGIMGVGCNRMNKYTVRTATQGLANYLNRQPKKESGHSVFISYDSRHQSRFFAEEAAKVLAANGIRVHLTRELRPTPLASFGCRFYNCTAGIMITASHNPPNYNGYKVYWDDGGQVLPPHDAAIIEESQKITNLKMIKVTEDLSDPLIIQVGEDLDQAYLDATANLQHYSEENQQEGHKLKIVFTNLHGTGITLVPKMLERWGFSHLTHVEEQKVPNGSFPTVTSPNPEDPEALQLGIKTLKEVQGDILLATDTDADRMGIVINHHGSMEILNGNQINAVCLEHICTALTTQNRMPQNGAFIKSLVTTDLFKAIAEAYHKPCFEVLPGFKYIAEKIRQWEQEAEGHQFLFGGEESYGYLLGTNTRDKDGVLACALLCEAALKCLREGKTLLDMLHDIYKKYGMFREKLATINYEEGKSNKEYMEAAMTHLRQNTPKTIGKTAITAVEDYQQSTKTSPLSGTTEPLTLPKSNILIFWLADESKIAIRPSGTEPKIKIYCHVIKKQFSSIEEAIKLCDTRAEELIEATKGLLV